VTDDAEPQLLGAADVRALAASLGVRPTKRLGQNFVVDANTVRRIVRAAGLDRDDVVVEVGPGLGSLTLALLASVRRVVAVEIDEALARALPKTVGDRAPSLRERLDVVHADALRLEQLPDPQPTALVANLPYNVAVPAILHLLAEFPTLRTVMVMVQAEVAERLAAEPGGKEYGVPSVKVRFFGQVRRCGMVSPTVFWPIPRVYSGLVRIDRHATSPWPTDEAFRRRVFELVDIAFAQRRKTSRNAFAEWAGSGNESARRLLAASIDPSRRGETLSVADFVRLLQRSGEWEAKPAAPQPAAPEPAVPAEPQTQEQPAQQPQFRVI
jgi:16S rRNA (adenine1518-N6/adenine1519-N6)-dimethyltransferase